MNMVNAKQAKTIPSKWVGIMCLGFILLINALTLSQITFRGFSTSDFGSFLDAGYRIYLGQEPYVDFFYHTGAVHLYLNAFFFLLFGFSKAAIAIHIITVSSLAMIALYFATHKKIPLLFSLMCTALTGMGFYWGYPQPWYDMTAHFWGVLAVAAFLLYLPFKTDKAAFWTCCFSGAMATLALFTKSNLGGTYGIAFFAVLMMSPKRWPALKGYLLGVCAITLFNFTVLCDPIAFYQSTLQGYGSGRGDRFMRMIIIYAWTVNGYWIPFLLVHFTTRRFLDQQKELKILLYGMCLVAVLGINIGSLRGPDHIPLLGTCLALAFVLVWQVRPLCQAGLQKNLNALAILILIGVTVFYSIRMTRMAMDVYEYPGRAEMISHHPLQKGPFKGWRFHEKEAAALDGLVDFASQHIPKDDSLLVLCDLHIAYGLLGMESYKGIVWQWPILPNPAMVFHMNGLYGQNIVNHPPDWIVARFLPDLNQPGFMRDTRYLLNFLKIPADFFKDYVPVKSWGEYSLLKRK